MVLFCVSEQDVLLIGDRITVALVGILLGEAAIECGDFISCP